MRSESESEEGVRRNKVYIEPEAVWSIHVQAEIPGKRKGGPNKYTL